MSWLWRGLRKGKDEEEEDFSGDDDEEYTTESDDDDEDEEEDTTDDEDDLTSSSSLEEKHPHSHHKKDGRNNRKDHKNTKKNLGTSSSMPAGEESGPEPGRQPQQKEQEQQQNQQQTTSTNTNNNNNAVAQKQPTDQEPRTVSSMEDDDDEEASKSSSSLLHDDEEDEDDDHHNNKKITGVEHLSIPQAVEVCHEKQSDEKSEKTTSSRTRVVGNRLRVDSAMSDDVDINNHHDAAENEEGAENEPNQEDEEEDEDADVNKTSLAEKQSLLVLAAEHDRVDILNAIMTTDAQQTDFSKAGLLAPTGTIPPLHIAVAYGSVNAVNGLLRIGADPGIRPNVAHIKQEATKHGVHLEISNISQYDGRTAWELVFGDGSDANEKPPSSWSFFSSSSAPENKTPAINSTQSPVSSPSLFRKLSSVGVVKIPPSKREGIRHAFTAEALRCIGSDDDPVRLGQLLQSGMPATIDIGGKSLYDWAVEMSASRCEELLRPAEAAKHETTDQQQEEKETEGKSDNSGYLQDENSETGSTENDRNNKNKSPSAKNGTNASRNSMQQQVQEEMTSPPKVHRPPPMTKDDHSMLSISHLMDRLDELDSLSRALSISLDALAEEASVCNGLLLMGGGASALASHVRSLKANKERKEAELDRLEEAWENSQDELAYWVREGGDEAEKIANQVLTADSFPLANSSFRKGGDINIDDGDEEGKHRRKQQVSAQIAAVEHKICKLRASIADLSEVCDRDLQEVHRRGLVGGVTLVRGLREEIRDFDFAITEIKSHEASCRTKISMIQSVVMKTQNKQQQQQQQRQLNSGSQNHNGNRSSSEPPLESNGVNGRFQVKATAATPGLLVPHHNQHSVARSNSSNNDSDTEQQNQSNSHRITTGQSTSLAIRGSNGNAPGFFSQSLWEILLRIIGLRDNTNGSSSERHFQQPVMIV